MRAPFKLTVLAAAMAAAPAMAADPDLLAEFAAMKARMERLEARNAVLEAALKTSHDESLESRVEALETANAKTEEALSTERVSEQEPELVTRLKAVEFTQQSMQKQARMVEQLEGITAGVAFTTVAQHASGASTSNGKSESQWNYRVDVAVGLPAGEIGNAEGSLFGQFRIGQGDGLTRILPTFGGVNATGFHIQGVNPDTSDADDAGVLLAQAWYQLDVPLPLGGFKPRSRETLTFNFGKMDPFVFFDQNAAADDESTLFLNSAFVHNPLLDAGGDVGVDSHGFTPGVRVAYANETDAPIAWGASLGVFGSGRGAAFDDSFSKPFYMIQLDTSQRFMGGLEGTYRLYYWHNGRATPFANEFDASTESHSGWGISADQRLGDAITVFGRYGHQLDGMVRFDTALTLGAEFGGSYWDRGGDAAGVALGWLNSSKDFRAAAPTLDADGDLMPDFGYSASGAETLAELYYRWRINSNFEVTPDFQLLSRPGADGSVDTVKVIGVRANLTY
jgi:high affinity Mn2+ porin